MKYIAYGSNMSPKQMRYRCPGAQFVGTGLLRGYQLEFNRHATIVESSNHAAAVPVAVWEITLVHEHSLDRYEGYPRYYQKITCTVDMKTGEHIQGMAYQMSEFAPNPPDRFYFEGICDAYEALGLRSEIESALLPALMRGYQVSRE